MFLFLFLIFVCIYIAFDPPTQHATQSELNQEFEYNFHFGFDFHCLLDYFQCVDSYPLLLYSVTVAMQQVLKVMIQTRMSVYQFSWSVVCMRCGSLIVHALTDLIRMSCWLLQVEFSNSHQYSWLRLKSEVTQCKCQGSPGFHLDCDVFIVLSTKMTTWTSSQVSNTTMKGESTSPVSTRLAWFCFFLHASTYLCTAAPDHHQKWKDNKHITLQYEKTASLAACVILLILFVFTYCCSQ